MEKEILKRGYITHCLTNGENIFYNNKNQIIHNWEKEKPLYWSEIYCEPNYFYAIIRKGTLFANVKDDVLNEFYKQSIINCGED